jgi:hypothetical protein
MGVPESRRREESMVCAKGSQDVGGAEGGTPARASDGANDAILFYGSGLFQRVREQAFHRKGVGIHLCVHVNISGACGDSRDVLHRIFPDGCEEVHGTARGTEEVPV